ncbi:MAG: hypothetical protein ACXADA_13535 [Candidatus Hodarchaeales archaeon]
MKTLKKLVNSINLENVDYHKNVLQITTTKDLCRLITSFFVGIKSEFWSYTIKIIRDNTGNDKLAVDISVLQLHRNFDEAVAQEKLE